MSDTVSDVFAVCASARILGTYRLDLFFDYLAYFANHFQCASADLIIKINLHIDSIFAVMNEASLDNSLEVLFHQKSIGGKLVFVVQMNASIMGEAELVVYWDELMFGLHQIVQNSSQAKCAALKSYTKHLLSLVQLRIVEERTFAAFLFVSD